MTHEKRKSEVAAIPPEKRGAASSRAQGEEEARTSKTLWGGKKKGLSLYHSRKKSRSERGRPLQVLKGKGKLSS